MTDEEMKTKPINRRTAIGLVAATFSKALNSDVNRVMCMRCLETLGVSEKEFNSVELEMGEKMGKM